MQKMIWGLALMTALAGCNKKKPAEDKTKDKPQTATNEAKGDKADKAKTPPPRKVEKLSAAVKQTEAVVADMAGTVSLQSPGMDPRPVTKDTTIHPGDILRTDSDGHVTIVLWDQTAVDLAPDSALLVEGSDSVTDPSPALTVMVGLAHIQAAKRKAGMGPLVIHSPNAAVTVTGTGLDVGVSLDATTKIGVEEGTVEVTGDATLNAKPVKLPKGKAVVITEDGKPGKVVAYSPDKENWSGWLDKTNKHAVAKADVVVQAHNDAIKEIKKSADTLEKAAEPLVVKADASLQRAEKAVAAKKAEELAAVQPEIVAGIESAQAAYETQRMFEAQLQARAYLIALLAARAKAGLIKLPASKIQVVTAGARLFPIYRARWSARFMRPKPRWKALHHGYYRFHPRGWRFAAVAGVSVKPVTVDLKFKPKPYRPVRVTIPGYTRPLYRPPFIKVKINPAVRVRLRVPGWHRGRSWKMVVQAPGLVRWRKHVVTPRLRRKHHGPKLRIHWRRHGRIVAPGVRIKMKGNMKGGVHLKRVHLGPRGVRVPGVKIGRGKVVAPGVRIRRRGGVRAGTVHIGRKKIGAGVVNIRLGRGARRRRHRGMGHGMGHH